MAAFPLYQYSPPPSPPPLHVFFFCQDGKSTASWSGQYQVCDGQEVLLTTWVLTGHTDTCRDHWSATTIGQDQFTRTPQITEPKSQRKGKKSKKEKSKYHINRKYYDKEQKSGAVASISERTGMFWECLSQTALKGVLSQQRISLFILSTYTKYISP